MWLLSFRKHSVSFILCWNWALSPETHFPWTVKCDTKTVPDFWMLSRKENGWHTQAGTLSPFQLSHYFCKAKIWFQRQHSDLKGIHKQPFVCIKAPCVKSVLTPSVSKSGFFRAERRNRCVENCHTRCGPGPRPSQAPSGVWPGSCARLSRPNSGCSASCSCF